MMAINFAISAQAAAVNWTTEQIVDRHGNAFGDMSDPFETTTEFSAIVSFLFWDTTLNDGTGDWVDFNPGGILTSSETRPFSFDLGAQAGNSAAGMGFANSAKYKMFWTVTGPEPMWVAEGNKEFTMPGSGDHNISLAPLKWEQIPEPATMALVGIGIVALGLRRRRK